MSLLLAFNIAISMAGFLAAFIIYNIDSRIKTVEKELQNHRIEDANVFVKREEFHNEIQNFNNKMDKVDTKLDKIFDRLDTKQDKE